MGEEGFEGGAEAVGPVGGEEGAGDIDPFVFGVGPDKVGEEGEVFLEEVDVEEAGGGVEFGEDFFSLLRGEVRVIVPLFAVCKGDRFFGKLFPPNLEEVHIGSGKGG